jgi:hypothetical protein
MIRIQIFTIVAYALFAFWYAVPALRRLRRADALAAIASVHVFRYIVLYIYQAQHEGYTISTAAARDLVIGDLAGAAIAIFAIALLRYRIKLGVAFCWLLVVETLIDAIVGGHQKSIDPPVSGLAGVWWLVFTFFAPLIMVSLPLLAWQLYSRRNESL